MLPSPCALDRLAPPHPTQAHFTEHMLFYRSEKYPKEDEYRCGSPFLIGPTLWAQLARCCAAMLLGDLRLCECPARCHNPRNAICCLMPCRAMRFVASRHAVPCRLLPHAMPCHAICCLTPCRDVPCHVMPYRLLFHAMHLMPCHDLPCHPLFIVSTPVLPMQQVRQRARQPFQPPRLSSHLSLLYTPLPSRPSPMQQVRQRARRPHQRLHLQRVHQLPLRCELGLPGARAGPVSACNTH